MFVSVHGRNSVIDKLIMTIYPTYLFKLKKELMNHSSILAWRTFREEKDPPQKKTLKEFLFRQLLRVFLCNTLFHQIVKYW